MIRKVISTDRAPTPGAHFSQGIVFNNVLYTAGQIGQNLEGEMQQDSIESEVDQIMRNLSEVAAAAGTSLDKTLKTTIFITELEYFRPVNDAYKKFLQISPPARSTVVVKDLAKGARVEIEAIIAID